MKVVEDERLCHNMTYPVGHNMKDVLSYISVFAELIRDSVMTGATINFLCRGSSGAIIAALVSSKLADNYGVRISHIKKDGESSHNGGIIPVMLGDYNIIIDDFISSGKTVNHIYQDFKEACQYRDIKANIHMLCVSGDVSASVDFIDELDVLICGRDYTVVSPFAPMLQYVSETETAFLKE